MCRHCSGWPQDVDDELVAALARAEQAEAREAVLRQALEHIHSGACAVVSASEVYGETEDTHLWREMLDTARAALAATATSAGEGDGI